MKEYIDAKIKILKQLCIWGKISKADRNQLRACTTQIQADNWMTTFRQRYM